MANWTTEDRQKMFEDYFMAEPHLSVEAYASGLPKDQQYVRGILDGTHYALETLPIAFRLFTQKHSGFNFGKVDDERTAMATQWVVAMTHLQTSIGIGRPELVGIKCLEQVGIPTA